MHRAADSRARVHVSINFSALLHHRDAMAQHFNKLIDVRSEDHYRPDAAFPTVSRNTHQQSR
jgi:hypothetical protein